MKVELELSDSQVEDLKSIISSAGIDCSVKDMAQIQLNMSISEAVSCGLAE